LNTKTKTRKNPFVPFPASTHTSPAATIVKFGITFFLPDNNHIHQQRKPRKRNQMSYISRANSDGFNFGFGLGAIFVFIIPGWFILGLFYPDIFEFTWIVFIVLFFAWLRSVLRDKENDKQHTREEQQEEQQELRDWFNSLPPERRAELVQDGTVTLTDAKTGKTIDPTPYITE